MLFFSVYGCMLCLVRYLFVISTSVIDCLGRFVPEMTYYVSSGTLNLAQLNSTYWKSGLSQQMCSEKVQIQWFTLLIRQNNFVSFVCIQCLLWLLYWHCVPPNVWLTMPAVTGVRSLCQFVEWINSDVAVNDTKADCCELCIDGLYVMNVCVCGDDHW